MSAALEVAACDAETAAATVLEVGIAAHRSGDLSRAEEEYAAVLHAFPAHTDALHLLGMCRHQRKRRREAFALVSKAIALRPETAQYHNTLGTILRSAGRLDEAAQAFSRATRLRPSYPEAENNLALVLCDLKRYDAAETVLRYALSGAPDNPTLHTTLGRLELLKDNPRASLESFRRALVLDPDHANALNNAGVVSNLMGDADGARHLFERALAIDPEHGDAHHNYGQLLLFHGRFEEGWPHFEWRLRRREYRRRFAAPQWRGESIDGRTILIWCEQGFGDAIQFIRYAPLVAAKGAHVVVECRTPLRRLFSGIAGVAEVVEPGDSEGYDFHVPAMSLPGIFGTDASSIPADVPYVPVPPASPIDGGAARLRVGLVWAGSPQNPRDRTRSRKLSEFAPLASLDDVAFFSLQVGAGADDPPPPGLNVTNLMPEVKDFHDTAADMAGLDLVLSVDSSSAHLAGAIGRPVWVLLDSVADWRWMAGRDDTPWYPSARLFRRRSDWQEVFGRVAAALTAFEPSR